MRIFFYILCAGLLALSLSVIFLTLWVLKIDNDWSPLIEPRIRAKQAALEIPVWAQNKDGEKKWIGSLSNGRLEERQRITLSDTPPLLVHALVQIEDPRFQNHEGFDLMGIFRAFFRNLMAMSYRQGGSTITQQLVKNIFLSNEKTLSRKFRELVIAALVEKRFSKDEILEAYLNEVYMGQSGAVAVHGVARASHFYFNRDLNDLSLEEMALLVAMIKGPGVYNPIKRPEKTKLRRDYVLEGLLNSELILEEEFNNAKKAPLPEKIHGLGSSRASYFLAFLKDRLEDSYSEKALLQGGFEISTTLDTDLQSTAEQSIRAKIKDWGNETQTALIALSTKDCSIKAYVGGNNYNRTQYDRLRKSKRSIGSLMKPLELMDYLNSGEANLGMPLEDRPLDWIFDKKRSQWKPENYDKEFRDIVFLREALEKSINIPIARFFFDRYPEGDLNVALEPVRSLGLTIPKKRALPSALLGAIEQRPIDVAKAYLMVARMALGQENADCELRFRNDSSLQLAADPSQEELSQKESFEKQILDEMSESTEAEEIGNPGQIGARLIVSALRGATRRGTSQWLGSQLGEIHPWGGKTGTSSDKKDSWFVALSPELVVLAWVGKDDNTKTSFTGASGALPLVADLVTSYASRVTQSNWPFPKGFIWRAVDEESHCLLNDVTNMSFNDLHPPPSNEVRVAPAVEFRERLIRHELFYRDFELPPRCKSTP